MSEANIEKQTIVPIESTSENNVVDLERKLETLEDVPEISEEQLQLTQEFQDLMAHPEKDFARLTELFEGTQVIITNPDFSTNIVKCTGEEFLVTLKSFHAKYTLVGFSFDQVGAVTIHVSNVS